MVTPASIDSKISLYSVPPSISQDPFTDFNSYILKDGLLKGQVLRRITKASWELILGTFTDCSIQPLPGTDLKYWAGEKRIEAVVSFKVDHNIKKGGSIQVIFPQATGSNFQFSRVYTGFKAYT